MKNSNKNFRLGIVGGMGPMAGVHLQRLIVEETPATRDQDHVEVVCFTDPSIPDRTESLSEDGGKLYVQAISKTAQTLAHMGVSVIAIPCNTAHARLEEIQKNVAAPIISMVELTISEIKRRNRSGTQSIGLLATDGTLKEKLYQKQTAGSNINWILPDIQDQQKLMCVIYAIKAGKGREYFNVLSEVLMGVAISGAQTMLLGCTELSLYKNEAEKLGYTIVDPLRVLAKHIVLLAGNNDRAKITPARIC